MSDGDSVARAPGRVVGVILAGGASRRMGVPKHTLRLSDGRTFGDAIAEALRDALCESLAVDDAAPRIVVAGLPDGAPPIADLEVITDLHPGLGPLAGLDATLHALAESADHLLVAPCDMPALTGAILRALLVPTRAAATVFTDEDGHVRPLPMRVAISAASLVHERLRGDDHSLRGLVSALGTHVVPCPTPGVLRSINTPEEFAGGDKPRPGPGRGA